MLWLILLIGYAIKFLYRKFSKGIAKFEKYGVKFHEPWPFLGNFAGILFRRESVLEINTRLHKEFSNERYYGVFRFKTPCLTIRDLDLIKQITIKEFDHFVDHKSVFQPDDFFVKTLFILKGKEWREMRTTLSPAFTSSKMRGMFSLMEENAKDVVNYFSEREEEVVEVDMHDVSMKYANDVIASSAFGIKCDSLRDDNNKFYILGKRFGARTPLIRLKLLTITLFPRISKFFNLTLIDKEVTDFFRGIVKETIETREAHNIFRPDMIQLLMEARRGRLKHDAITEAEKDTGFATAEESDIGKLQKYQTKELTDDDIAAQALIFFLAGFDTTSTVTGFMAYELAINPETQAKLLAEVDKVWVNSGGNPMYEGILQMKYLDQVVTETLRKWPPAVEIERECTRDFTIEPVGPNEKPYHVKKGEQVIIPQLALQRDPKHFPNPESFDPDRFSDENKDKIAPGSYLPFGSGPRNCIGSRFALLEIKILYFHLLRHFEIIPTAKTDIPVKLGGSPFLLRPENGLRMGLKKRQIEKTVK